MALHRYSDPIKDRSNRRTAIVLAIMFGLIMLGIEVGRVIAGESATWTDRLVGWAIFLVVFSIGLALKKRRAK